MPNPLIEVMRLGVAVLQDTLGEIMAIREELDREHGHHDLSQGFPTGNLIRQGDRMKRLDELLAFQMATEDKTGGTFENMILQALATISAWEKMNADPRGIASLNVAFMLDPPKEFP